jgi:hypothetical protein
MAEILTHFKTKLAQNEALADIKKPQKRQSIQRTEKETKDYSSWRHTRKPKTMVAYVFDEYFRFQSTPLSTHDGIDFYASPLAKGFRLHPALTRFSDAHVQHFFDYLKDKLVSLQYHLVESETQLFDRDYWMETVHRYILNPANTEGGAFSKITIEMILKNGHLCTLRFDAQAPSSDMPHSTNDFADLLMSIQA